MINKKNNYSIRIEKDNDNITIEYIFDFSDKKYFKRDTDKINCNNDAYYTNYILNENNNDLLNKLDCDDSYIKDIKEKDLKIKK